ncbi:2Fe-2S iron-sulfur cluster binding domain-containing protein [bacterium]|jgi:2Fe-2S ferredoxin|nr:2Fe-2S iron-sulfur cluster binding domain-containing protein [bacterium]
MPKITFLPVNQSFDVPAGERILDVAIANDVPLMHACGGFCACTTCHVLVKSGMDQLAPPEEEELDRMETLDGRTDVSRLGCQSKILGDVVVEIVNLDE